VDLLEHLETRRGDRHGVDARRHVGNGVVADICSNFLKPGASTLTVYVPGTTAGTSYSPPSLVATLHWYGVDHVGEGDDRSGNDSLTGVDDGAKHRTLAGLGQCWVVQKKKSTRRSFANRVLCSAGGRNGALYWLLRWFHLRRNHLIIRGPDPTSTATSRRSKKSYTRSGINASHLLRGRWVCGCRKECFGKAVLARPKDSQPAVTLTRWNIHARASLPHTRKSICPLDASVKRKRGRYALVQPVSVRRGSRAPNSIIDSAQDRAAIGNNRRLHRRSHP
jgi:hypothetical protein